MFSAVILRPPGAAISEKRPRVHPSHECLAAVEYCMPQPANLLGEPFLKQLYGKRMERQATVVIANEKIIFFIQHHVGS